MNTVKNAYISSMNNSDGDKMAYFVEYASSETVRAVYDKKGGKRTEKKVNGHWVIDASIPFDSIVSDTNDFLNGETVREKVKPLTSAQQAQALEQIPAIVLKQAADEKMGAFMLDALQGETMAVERAKLARAYMHEYDTASAYEQVEGDSLALALLIQALDREDQNRLISYISCIA